MVLALVTTVATARLARFPQSASGAIPLVRLDDIIAFADARLAIGDFDDHGPNGLQIPGAADVATVVTGVSAHLALLEAAAAEDAQLVIAHHGLLWDAAPRRLTRAAAARLRALLAEDIGLAMYHLPLDAHPEIGNNALLADGLGAARHEPFAPHRGRPIGRVAHFDGDGIPATELFERVAALTGREPLAFDTGPARVHTLGLVSGAAAGSLDDAIALGLDAFLTGEPAERAMADAREAGIHFIAAGHYATETFGIRRLGDEIAARFGVRHRFLDFPNPV